MFDGVWDLIGSAFIQAFVAILSAIIVGLVMWFWRSITRSHPQDSAHKPAKSWSRGGARMKGRATSETEVSYKDNEQYGRVQVVKTKETFIGGAAAWGASKGENTEIKLPGGTYLKIGSDKNTKENTKD